MYVWAIFEKRALKRIVKKLPQNILFRYEAWKRIVELSGPTGLRTIKGFHDEALKGVWKGYRSSRLGDKWRIIYLAKAEVFEVFVIEINPHEY